MKEKLCECGKAHTPNEVTLKAIESMATLPLERMTLTEVLAYLDLVSQEEDNHE